MLTLCDCCLYKNTDKCKICSKNYDNQYKKDDRFLKSKRVSCKEYDCPFARECGYLEHCNGTFYYYYCGITGEKCDESRVCNQCPIGIEEINKNYK